MNLRWRLKEYCQKNKQQRWDFCEKFSMWHFVTKSTDLKSVKPGTSSYFSESIGPTYVGSATCPECSRRDWRGTSCWLHPLESGPEVVQRPGGLTTSPTLLGPVMVWSQGNWDCCWSWGMLGSRKVALPGTLPKGKWARNEWMNEYVDFNRTFLFMKLSLDFLPKVTDEIKWLWNLVKIIRHRRGNGVDTLKFHHNAPLKKTSQKHWFNYFETNSFDSLATPWFVTKFIRRRYKTFDVTINLTSSCVTLYCTYISKATESATGWEPSTAVLTNFQEYCQT